MAYLIQILLPLRDNQGEGFPGSLFADVRAELAGRFGGVTAYLRAPAEGVWVEGESGEVDRDQIVIYEVMAERLERSWWAEYRSGLATRFRQEELVVRAMEMERL